MKLVSWNIERGYDASGIAAMLAAQRADLYLLTELDRGVRRTGGVDMVAVLEAALGLRGHYAREFVELESAWRRVIPTGGPGGGEEGNGVFSGLEVKGMRVVALPTNAALRWERRTLWPELFEPRIGGRIAQAFEVELGGREVTVISTHLENWRCGWEHRRAQLQVALAERRGEACILAGDLNPLGGITKTWLSRRPPREVLELRRFLESEGLFDPFEDDEATCFNFGTRAKLDWVALSPELEVGRREVIRTGLSDHSLLIVELG